MHQSMISWSVRLTNMNLSSYSKLTKRFYERTTISICIKRLLSPPPIKKKRNKFYPKLNKTVIESMIRKVR